MESSLLTETTTIVEMVGSKPIARSALAGMMGSTLDST
jgi:hypothetical protein